MFLEDNRIFVPFLTTCTVVHGREKGNPPTQIINLEIFDKDIQLFKSYTASSVATDTEVLKLDRSLSDGWVGNYMYIFIYVCIHT